jgi:hypothetical protein
MSHSLFAYKFWPRRPEEGTVEGRLGSVPDHKDSGERKREKVYKNTFQSSSSESVGS